MSKHLNVVNNTQEAIEAEKTLEQPFAILNKETNQVILKDKDYSDVTILIDDENNYHPEVPVIQNDISWIKGKRCLVKKTDNGVAICYLDENNSELFHDGTTVAKLDGSMGQWMTDLPEFNIECVEGEDDWVKLYISKDKEIGHKSRRVLVGVTKAINRSGKLWSAKHSPGVPDDSIRGTTSLSSITFHNYANALGTGFDIIDYETHCKLAYMFMAKYGSRNPQGMKQFGSGGSVINSILGTTSTLGNADGKTNTQVNIFGVEDPYLSIYEWMGGIHWDGNNGIYYIYDGFEPDKVPTVPYRTLIDTPYYSSAYIDRMYFGDHADLIPIRLCESTGTAKTFYCDYGYIGYSEWKVVNRSSKSSLPNGGFFCFDAHQLSSAAHEYYGSRLQYRGKITVIDDPQEFIALPVGF